MKIILLVLFSIQLSLSLPSGLSLVFSEKAINGFKALWLKEILSELHNLEIPSQCFKTGKGILTTKWDLYDFSLTNIQFDINSTQINIIDTDHVVVDIEDFLCEIFFKWNSTSELDEDSGSASISLQKTIIMSKSTLYASNGHLGITINELELKIGNFDVEVYDSKNAKIVNWLTHNINAKIKSILEKEISKNIKHTVEYVINIQLSQFPTLIEVPHTPFSFSVALPYGPYINSGFMKIDILGIFVAKNEPNLFPQIPLPVDLLRNQENELDVQLFISDYTINSALYSMYSIDMFDLTITQKDLPSWIKLTTSFLDEILPGIESAYGPKLPCEVNCAAKKTPLLNTHEYSQGNILGLVSGSALIQCSVEVVDHGKAIEIESTLNSKISVILADGVLKGEIMELRVENMNVTESKLSSEIDTDGLSENLNNLIEISIPEINDSVFGKGFKLSYLEAFNIVESKMTVKTGYFHIQLEPKYPDLTNKEYFES
ncbi:unnamed protein product [Blepharisma stoltei]|uniref:Lipid-binding serum glycoprotein C-terminal domain-containing protein n=1 Tax=Blepharisma stoltei TaxID=1481888 RepID=A0AAU9JCS8_9CILI|nr:unnamed protein product [Blepharisma stoltei]